MLKNLPTSVRVPQLRPGCHVHRASCISGPAHFIAHMARGSSRSCWSRISRWGISAVSLRNRDVRDALAPQQNLYSLTLRGETLTRQIIGALREVLVAPENVAAVLTRLAAPTTRVVTMTVTEKGYCLNGEGSLNRAHPDIAYDLAHPRQPRSLIGFLVAGLRLRRGAKIAPFVSLSCDNLPDNGTRLARATTEFARLIDPDLARWIEAKAAFPRTMVDSITPATTDELRRETFEALGVHDRWPVQREALRELGHRRPRTLAGPRLGKCRSHAHRRCCCSRPRQAAHREWRAFDAGVHGAAAGSSHSL